MFWHDSCGSISYPAASAICRLVQYDINLPRVRPRLVLLPCSYSFYPSAGSQALSPRVFLIR